MITYFEYTGNRYTDAGLSFLVAYTSKEADKLTKEDAKSIIGYIAEKVEEKETQNTLMGMICPNNSILDVNSSIKRKIARKQFGKEYKKCNKTEKEYVDKKGIEHTKEELNRLIDELTPLKDMGSCLICGRRKAEKNALRSNIPLLGSGKFRNFFYDLNEGYPICKGCLFLTQLMPFALEKCGNMLLLFSDRHEIMEAWAKEKQKKYVTMAALGKGGLSSFESSNYKSLVIKEIRHLISQYESVKITKNPYIEVLYLNNYGTKQSIRRLILPDKIFNFLVYTTKRAYKSDWSNLIRRNVVQKKDKEIYNKVYERIFQDKSISYLFYNDKEKKVNCSWNLMEKYQMEVHNMKKEQSEIAKKLGTRIGSLIVETDRKKTLTDIEAVKTKHDFEEMRININKKCKELGKDPILTADELITLNLEYENWHEIYEIVIFAIYEKIQDWYKLNYVKKNKDVENKEVKEG